MKIGIMAERSRLGLLDAIRFASQCGAEGVQINASHKDGFNFVNITDEEISSLKRCCKENRLVITAVCGDISQKSFQVPSEADMRIKTCCRIIDGMKKLGANILTTHIGCIPESIQDPVYPVMVKNVRSVAEYAAKQGCVLAVETGPEFADVLLNFIETVDSEGLKVNLDPANLRGIICEDPVYAVKTLASYIVHTHAKDAVNLHSGSAAKFYGLRNLDGTNREISARAAGFQEVPLGEGMVDWDAYIGALREISYDGFLTIERECGENPGHDIGLAVVFLKNKLA